MRGNKLVWMSIGVILFAIAVAAQDQPTPVIKSVPAKNTSAVSGAEMFKSYCAACHGTDAKGNGPAAAALKVPPTDLTLLSKNNGGKFPDMKVVSAIRGDTVLPAHGTKEMPVWGQVFWSLSHGHEGEVQQRTANLTKYIEGLQAQ
jgi:mono/diheme cytochrome c family protein